MPVRIALTGQTAGPDVGTLLSVLEVNEGECLVDGFTALPERIAALRACLDDL